MINNHIKAPLFIIGNPRSGTSLLRLMLTCNSKITIPPECSFILWLFDKYSNWNPSDSSNILKVESFLGDLFECKKFETWFLSKKNTEEEIMLKKPKNYAELCLLIYEVYGQTKAKPFSILGDKNNYYLNYINELHLLYTNARFLHIVRNGLDVACSYRNVMNVKSKSPYAPKLCIEISDIALEWSNNLSKIHSSFALLPKECHKTIRYEDLVNHPKSTLYEVCEWLRVEFEPSMLKFYIKNKIDKLEPELTMDWKKRTLEPISRAFIGIHSKQISSKEQEVFFRIAKNELNNYSYL